jgi:hypothetical protein
MATKTKTKAPAKEKKVSPKTGRPVGAPEGRVLKQVTRDRIRAGVLLDRWQKIAEGKIVADPQQLAIQERAIRGLMAKVLPDLSSTDVNAMLKGDLKIEMVQFKRK